MAELRDATPYRVLYREGRPNGGALMYPADDEALARLVEGDRGFDYATARALPGAVVTDLPAASIKGLLAAGAICVAGGKDDAYAKAEAEGGATVLGDPPSLPPLPLDPPPTEPPAESDDPERILPPLVPPPTEPGEPDPPSATASAKALMGEYGLDAGEVAGTGKDGKVTKPDVEAHLDALLVGAGDEGGEG